MTLTTSQRSIIAILVILLAAWAIVAALRGRSMIEHTRRQLDSLHRASCAAPASCSDSNVKR